MNWISFGTLFFAYCELASAARKDKYRISECPYLVPVVKPFSLKKWSNMYWYVQYYESEDQFGSFTDDVDCLAYKYKLGPQPNDVSMSIKAYTEGMKKSVYKTVYKGHFMKRSGIIKLNSVNEVAWGRVTSRIIDTDFDSYAVLIHCARDRANHHKRYISVRVISRHPNFEPINIRQLRERLKQYGLYVRFSAAKQDSCPKHMLNYEKDK